MPSTTPRQKRTMAAAAHDPAFARRMGIPQNVAKDFNRADQEAKMDTKSYAKGGDVRTASYATGGAVLGRTRSFMKEPDQFRDYDGDDLKTQGRRTYNGDKCQNYGKSGAGAGNPNPSSRGKQIKG